MLYKPPTSHCESSEESVLLSTSVMDADGDIEHASESFRFATAVAEFGMLLRGSQYAGDASMEHVIALARSAQGYDSDGDRGEFIQLVQLANTLVAVQQRPQIGMRE